MKKRISKLLACGLALAMFAGCLAPFLDVSAREETITIRDEFNNGEHVGTFDSDVWTGYGSEGTIKTVELVKPQKVLRGEGKNITGETNVLMTKEWYWEIRSLSFDMYIPANADWAFIDFVDIDDPMDYLGDFGEHGDPMCYGAMMVKSDNDFSLARTTWKDWGFGSDEISDTWVSVKFVSKDAQNGKVMIAPKGQAFDESKAQPLTLAGNKSFYNSNFVFGDYKFSGYMLDNFVVETDMGTYKEDFEDGKNDLFEEISMFESEETCFPIVEYGGTRKLEFENAAADDRIIANTILLQEDEHLQDSDVVLEVSFHADFSKASEEEEIAYVFGLTSNDALPFSDNYAFVMSRNRVRLSYFDIDENEKILEARSRSVSGNVHLTLTKGGTFTANIGGSQAFQYSSIENYAGNSGLVAKTAISKVIYVDDMMINNTYFDVITTKSWSDDFKKNKLGTGTNSDYAWNADSGAIRITDEEVAFEACSDNTYFGPAYKYETFELSFQLTSIFGTKEETEKMEATYLDKWLGLDFGKSDSMVKAYGTYGMMAIKITAPEDGSAWTEAGVFTHKSTSSNAMTGETLTLIKPIPASYFENIYYDKKTKQREDILAEDAICFKFVALEDKVELYLKKASDAEYTLHAIVENVDPKGYVAICCTGYTSWTIDNFEIKNTAEIYNEAPEIVLEEIVLPTLAERGVGIEDTSWEREQKMNADRKGGVPVALIIGIGAAGVVIGGAAGVIVYCKKKKKAGETA